MNEPDYQEDLNEFANKLFNLCEEYSQRLPAYEMVTRLIALASSMALCCAPTELGGVKTLHAALQIGINEYERTHS